MKLKLNIKNVIVFAISTIATIIFLNDWKVVLFNWATLIYWGIFTNMCLFVIAFKGFEYLNEYVIKKELKKKYHHARK